MLESWMISAAISISAVIATFAVLKQKVADSIVRDSEQDLRFKEFKNRLDDELQELQKFKNESKPHLEHLSRVEQALTKKLDFHSENITKLNQQITQAPTMKEVRDEFVSKEMFHQMQKHIDEKFDKLEMGLAKILDKLERGN
jgi:hypothetical protein